MVCKHCSRDLSVVRGLTLQLEAATAKLETLEAASVGVTPVVGQAPSYVPPSSLLPGIESISAMALAFIVLVVAHYVIIIEYSMPLIVLRVVSIAVPLAFGLLCRETERETLAVEFLYGVIIALASILVMSKVVGKIDTVPVLPRNAHEWREFAEYGASIAFGFFTGVIIRRMLIAAKTPDVKPPWLIDMASRALAKKIGDKPGFNLATIQSLVSAASAAGSGVTSVVTGLSQFF